MEYGEFEKTMKEYEYWSRLAKLSPQEIGVASLVRLIHDKKTMAEIRFLEALDEELKRCNEGSFMISNSDNFEDTFLNQFEKDAEEFELIKKRR